MRCRNQVGPGTYGVGRGTFVNGGFGWGWVKEGEDGRWWMEEGCRDIDMAMVFHGSGMNGVNKVERRRKEEKRQRLSVL